MQAVVLIILCYLIGSIPFSLIFGLLLGKVDIRTKGSGNIGATNVLRSSGLAVAILALIADMGKGVAGAWIGSAYGGAEMAAICSGAVLLGHCFSVFLKFRGGKGVATSAGVIGFLMPGILGILALIVIIMVFITRYMSLGSIMAAIALPILTAFIFPKPMPYILLSLFMAVLVLYRHRGNIQRLISGTESKITDKV